MGWIYERNGTFYHAFRWSNRTVRQSLKTKDKKVAVAKFKLREAKLAEKTLKVPIQGSLDIEGLIGLYVEKKARTTELVTTKALMRFQKLWATFFRRQGVYKVSKITSEHIEQYVDERTVQNSTISNELQFLKSVLAYGVKSGKITEAPRLIFPDLKVKHKDAAKLGPYSPEDIVLLKEYFRGKDFYDLFIFYSRTGARKMEAARVKACDVDFRGNTLTIVQAKTRSSYANQHRHLDIHPELKEVLIARVKGLKPDDLVFPELAQSGTGWATDCMTEACEALGIKYRRLHGIRHSVITGLLMSGIPLLVVMRIAGHTQASTTLKYAHTSQNDLRGQIEKLPW